MKKLWTLLMKGLAAVLPVGLTIYIVVWLGRSAEALMHDLITLILPERHYWPGLGLLVGFAVLIGVGVFVNAFVVRWFLGAWERFLARIPLVKTVYAAIRDLVKFLPSGNRRKDMRRVVAAEFAGGLAIGFVTRESVTELQRIPGAENLVAVYFPMSYQIGGYTVYLPPERLKPLDLGVEEAMRIVLTGGMSNTDSHH
jgi:uncharacterized membrane protein